MEGTWECKLPRLCDDWATCAMSIASAACRGGWMDGIICSILQGDKVK